MKRMYGDVARPDLPKPGCRVYLVCGPPAAGKTTYVRNHAGLDDIVIDLDAMRSDDVGLALQARNRKLAALADEPPERVAWVIVCAPAASLRQWWSAALGDAEIILLVPPRAELYKRMRARGANLTLIDKWFERERTDNPGHIKSGCDENGYPIDPLHPWNRL